MQATPQQVRLLQHTLGLSEHQRRSYRNHFVAGRGHHDMPDLEELERQGLMARVRTPAFCEARDIVFVTTTAGAALALERLPEPPPPQKQTQYRQWLDADTGCTFREWLCGSRLPKFEKRGYVIDGTLEYRMYRTVWDGDWDSYRDVQGQWASTKKEAKASYKAALKARQQAQRAQAPNCTRCSGSGEDPEGYLTHGTGAAPQAPAAPAVDAETIHLQDLKNALAECQELRQQLTLMDEQQAGSIWRWQAVRLKNGDITSGVVLAGYNGWRDGNYEPINVEQWLKPERWFASPDDAEGKTAEYAAYRHAVLYERKSPLRAQAQQKGPAS